MEIWQTHTAQSTARQLVFLWYSTRRAGAWSGCPQAAGFLPSLSDIVILYTNSLFTIEHRWIHPFHALNLYILYPFFEEWRNKLKLERVWIKAKGKKISLRIRLLKVSSISTFPRGKWWKSLTSSPGYRGLAARAGNEPSQSSTITERASSWLKVPTSAFIF